MLALALFTLACLLGAASVLTTERLARQHRRRAELDALIDAFDRDVQHLTPDP